VFEDFAEPSFVN